MRWLSIGYRLFVAELIRGVRRRRGPSLWDIHTFGRAGIYTCKKPPILFFSFLFLEEKMVTKQNQSRMTSENKGNGAKENISWPMVCFLSVHDVGESFR
jgi:hypothetical protein